VDPPGLPNPASGPGLGGIDRPGRRVRLAHCRGTRRGPEPRLQRPDRRHQADLTCHDGRTGGRGAFWPLEWSNRTVRRRYGSG